MRIVKARALEKYQVELAFSDGTTGVVDLGHLAGAGVFAAWDEPGAFADVSVGSGGELCWRCGVELCADSLYLRLTGKDARQVLPGLDVESAAGGGYGV